MAPRIRPAPRLYILTPPVSDPAALSGLLAETSRAVDVAAVLLRLPDADERSLINMVKALAPGVQGAGAALLVDGRPDIVARAGADGAHLAGPDALKEALPGLKPNHIAGAGSLHSRHDAMVVARFMPAAMMFVPSIGGISHDVRENTSDADIIFGCEVLADAVAQVRRQV